MPILGNDYAPPTNMPTGLALPGQGPYVPPPSQRELTLGQMGGVGLEGLQTALQIPGFVARNIGPALVGRNLQGPTSSAEALGRLGLDYNSPAQRAIGHGLGAGLDFMADPMMLGGLGAGNRAAAGAANAAASEATLARRLEQFAGPGLQGSLTGPQTAYGFSGPVARHAPGVSPPFLHPRIPRGANPGSTIADGLVQVPPGGFPNFPMELQSAQYMNPGSGSLTRQLESMATPTAASRLDRFAGTPAATSVGGASSSARPLSDASYMRRLGFSPEAAEAYANAGRLEASNSLPNIPGLVVPDSTALGNATMARRLEQFRSPTVPPNRQGTIPDVPTQSLPMPGQDFSRQPASGIGPPMSPAPATSGLPAQFVTGTGQPPELGPLNLRAAFEALRNPGRGNTIGPRSPTIQQPPPGDRYPWEY